MEIKQDGNWWKTMSALDARNPEVLNVDGGTMWTKGQKGDIFEDRFYYVPKDFGWLGEKYKDVKSLVSGIGLKITNIEGERFTRDMNGVTFGSMRSERAKKGAKGSGDALSRKLSMERVAYYKPNGGDIWELGEGTCAIDGRVGDRPVYLFVGAVGVDRLSPGANGGYNWRFKKEKFFDGTYGCEVFRGRNKETQYRLIKERVKTAGSAVMGEEEVIVLGVNQEVKGKAGGNVQVNGVLDFGASRRVHDVIGVLMGVAINLSYAENCKEAFGRSSSRETSEEIDTCIRKAKNDLKRRIQEAEQEGGGKEIELKSWKFDEKWRQTGGKTGKGLDQEWVTDELKTHLRVGGKFATLSRWKQDIKLSYKYS